MPKAGSAVCNYCGFTQMGIFPDHKPIGSDYQFAFQIRSKYISERNTEDKFDPHIADELLDHHLDTRKIDEDDPNRIKSTGHSRYSVELEDGSKGELTANPYAIVYKELGKERQY